MIALERSTQTAIWLLCEEGLRAAGVVGPHELSLTLEPEVRVELRRRWLGLRREAIVSLGLPVISALTKEALRHRLAPTAEILPEDARLAKAFENYWTAQVMPVIAAGFRPPIVEGWRHYLASPLVSKRMEIALLPVETPTAVSVLRDLERLEAELVVASGAGTETGATQTIAWGDVAEMVYLPAWKEIVRGHATILSGVTPATLFDLARDPVDTGRRLAASDPSVPTAEHPRRAVATLGALLSVLLADLGYRLSTLPGEHVQAARDGRRLYPFEIVRKMANGEISAEEWEAECRALGGS